MTTVNARLTINPNAVITIELAEYNDLLLQGLIYSIEGGAPVDYPDFTPAQYAELSSRIAAAVLPKVDKIAPPTGAVTAGVFNPARSVYNLKASHLRRTRAKLATTNAGSGFCKIGTIGHSMVAGLKAVPGKTDWPSVLLGFLEKAGYPNAGDGFVTGYRNLPDPRLTLGAGWALLSGSLNLIQNSTNANPATFTGTLPATVVDLWYWGASGPFGITIDGGAAIPVTPSGATVPEKYTITGLANTAHIVTVTRTSGTVIIYGPDSHHATSGVRLANLGIGGINSTQLADANVAAAANVVGRAAAWGADLVLIECMYNSLNAGDTTAIFKTRMQSVITNAKHGGADIVLVTDTPFNVLNGTAYLAALYELADSNDVPLVDMFARQGTYAVASGNGLIDADGVHPTPAGYADQARTIFNALEL